MVYEHSLFKELVPVVVGRVYKLDKSIAQRLVIPSSQSIGLGVVRVTNPVVEGWSGGWYELQTRWSRVGLGGGTGYKPGGRS